METFIPNISYEMNHIKTGLATILYCEPDPPVKYLNVLNEIFLLLGFLQEDIEFIKYSGKEQLKDKLAKVAKNDHRDCDCFFAIILFQGNLNLLFARDEAPPAHDIWEAFTANRSPTLAEKPKLFVFHQLPCDSTGCSKNNLKYTMPTYSDFFFAFTSQSCLGTADCYLPIPLDIVREWSGSVDFLTMVVEGNRLMKEVDPQRMSSYFSTLTSQIYFKSKTSQPNPEKSVCIPEYKMDHRCRGTALIFSHSEFLDRTQLNTVANLKDHANLRDVLCNVMGFEEPQVVKNPDSEKIRSEIKKASEADYTDCDCVLVAALTHGNFGTLESYNGTYSIKELWEPFLKNKTLEGKPKIFLIQACQGAARDDPHLMNDSLAKCGENKQFPANADENLANYAILHSPDILIAMASPPGFLSLHREASGSWFIQCLCLNLKNHFHDHNFINVLSLTNQYVAVHFENNDGTKQIPCFMSSLTRHLKFVPKEKNLI